MYQRILVPINGISTSEKSLLEAIKIADGKATLRLLHVLEVILPIITEGYDLESSVVMAASLQTRCLH